MALIAWSTAAMGLNQKLQNACVENSANGPQARYFYKIFCFHGLLIYVLYERVYHTASDPCFLNVRKLTTKGSMHKDTYK